MKRLILSICSSLIMVTAISCERREVAKWKDIEEYAKKYEFYFFDDMEVIKAENIYKVLGGGYEIYFILPNRPVDTKTLKYIIDVNEKYFDFKYRMVDYYTYRARGVDWHAIKMDPKGKYFSYERIWD